jgi:hypothetical protein
VLVHELEDLADVSLQLAVESSGVGDRRVTLRPQPLVTRLEQVYRQLLLPREVLVQRRIGVTALRMG